MFLCNMFTNIHVSLFLGFTVTLKHSQACSSTGENVIPLGAARSERSDRGHGGLTFSEVITLHGWGARGAKRNPCNPATRRAPTECRRRPFLRLSKKTPTSAYAGCSSVQVDFVFLISYSVTIRYLNGF